MKISRTTVSLEELESLKRLVSKVSRTPRTLGARTKDIAIATKPQPAPETSKRIDEITGEAIPSKKLQALFNGGIAKVKPSMEPLKMDNPVDLLLTLKPELKPYKWQFEELMRMAGYLETGKYNSKTNITDVLPYKLCLPAANGSGKDEVLIATFAIWFILTGAHNRVIITSSSKEQTKYQTEVHIRDLANRANKEFGTLIKYVEFHYVVPQLGSEIKLFATDEPGRAEGYHPFYGGKMAIILNEAKTIREDLFDAIDRCTGYSHLLYISSPGPKRGRMFKSVANAICYPANANLGRFYYRKVTAFECPHIAKSHIDEMIYQKGKDAPWVRSSIFAEFSDYDEPVAIPEYSWDQCYLDPPDAQGEDIGIGLDLAGGGDEDSIWVRRGNRPLFDYHFTQKDTESTARVIDIQLSPWKGTDYIFRADNGGIGQAIIDKLRDLGWRIRRTNNQSPSYSKTEFLNLGAELYFYVKRLIERKDIILPGARKPNQAPLYHIVDKLKAQLTTRRYKGEESTQGKFALQSKPEARNDGLDSPDRADGFVLCFSSYHPNTREQPKEEGPKKYTIAELLALSARGMLFSGSRIIPRGRHTSIAKI